MYSPKIAEELIPEIYRISKSKGKPMTHVVNEIIGNALYSKERKNQKKGETAHAIATLNSGIGKPKSAEVG
ncbi:hypothetical protein HY745_12765 [Candidatus Desantisbacteria bacterium]|nr:hypothetical protein [Candidatus Desantisbacteria bacterium]